ncbi:hypothetical protein [Brevibacillus borstelensis]|uniref:hypothetical protein n=1 Tax=Brevibacillus borstelensis TaxID=45462 RepID=UPI002E22EC80|nr:hypothetical protein [Brevibacillus borstelensis]
MNKKANSLKQVVRFLFPEIQLVELVKREGFIAKKEAESKQPYTRQAAEPSVQEAVHSGSFAEAAAGQSSPPVYQHIVSPPNRVAEPVQKEGSGAWSASELDQIFRAAENEVNHSVIGQNPFVKDLVAAYKQGYINVRQDKPRNVILLAGAAGTGKKTALDSLVYALFSHGLTISPQVIEIDASRYEADEISGNFIRDMAYAFQEFEGTVLFRGIAEADPAIVGLVAKLATEGSFRTKEGVQISASDYFLVFYMDHAVTEAVSYGQIPAELASHVPAPILQGVQAAAISSPVNQETMQQIAKSLLDQAVSKLSHDTQTTITVNRSVYERLAGIATTNRTFGEAVQLLLMKIWI